MNCSHYEPLIALHVEGDLLGRKVQQLEEHLKHCASCRKFAEKIQGSQRLLKTLREEPFEESIFQNLHDNVLARVSVSPSDALPFGIRWLGFAWRWRIPAVVSLTVLMAGVVYWSLFSTTPHTVRRKDSLAEISSETSQQKKPPTTLAEVGSLPSQDPARPQAGTIVSQGQAHTQRSLQGKIGAQAAVRNQVRKNRTISNVSRNHESIAQETPANKPIMFEPIHLIPIGKAFEVTRFEPVEVQTIKIDIPESPEQVAIKLPSSDPNIVILWLVDR